MSSFPKLIHSTTFLSSLQVDQRAGDDGDDGEGEDSDGNGGDHEDGGGGDGGLEGEQQTVWRGPSIIAKKDAKPPGPTAPKCNCAKNPACNSLCNSIKDILVLL